MKYQVVNIEKLKENEKMSKAVIAELNEFFIDFDEKKAKIQNAINTQSIQVQNEIDTCLQLNSVGIKLDRARQQLIDRLNKEFKFHFENVKKTLLTKMGRIEWHSTRPYDDLNDYRLILFKFKCKMFDYGLLCSYKKEILNESILDIFSDDVNQTRLNELLAYVEATFGNLKILFKTSNQTLNVTYLGDVVMRNELINIAKCNYFHFFNIFADMRLANETLALDNYLNYKRIAMSPDKTLVYPKSFQHSCRLQILGANGNELFYHIKENMFQLVPYHFILTEKRILAVFYNSDNTSYEIDLYDHRLNVIRSATFRKHINLIAINAQSIQLRSSCGQDAFNIDLSLGLTSVHLQNRILFSYNNTYQGHMLKMKSDFYLFAKIVSSHLQTSDKSLILAVSTNTCVNNQRSSLVLEFTSYDKKYYHFDYTLISN